MPGAQRRRKVISKLTKDDQVRVTALVDAALAAGHDPVGESVYGDLERLAAHAADAPWAEGALKLLTIERLDLWGKDRAREVGTTVNLGESSAFVSDLRSARVRIYTDDGVAFAWQHEFWWQAEWDRLAQMIQMAAAQQDTLGEKVAGMRRLYALRERVPDTRNGEEACASLGMSVEQFLASAPS